MKSNVTWGLTPAAIILITITIRHAKNMISAVAWTSTPNLSVISRRNATVPAKLTFDPACIKKVPIEAVTPNSWNPKEKDTEEYHKVKRSLELHGLRGAILGREARAGSGFDYEIIDGEQRFTAATELGFKELYVYNLGTVVDKEAKAMTIWWEVQVPFDTPQLSKLVVELDDTRTELPFSGAQL